MTQTAVAVQLTNVTKTYRQGDAEVPVLAGVNLAVPAGEFLAIMGPSGSGKSTILNLVAGLDRPSSGSVRVGEVDLAGMGDSDRSAWRAHNVGYIFQRYHLLAVLNASKNVEIPLLLTSLPRAERKRRVATALDLVGMTDRARHLPRQLSGGQEQRVAIARSIVADPKVILADEPTGDLDAASAKQVLELLTLLSQRLKKTILMVTHDPQAAGYAHRTVQLHKGVLQAAGVPSRPAAAPQTPISRA
jgi:putative ABC transport system ATP-binding protein